MLDPENPLGLPTSCWYRPEEWRRWQGIEGPVLICQNHGLPAPSEAYEDSMTTVPCQEDFSHYPLRQNRPFRP